MQVRTSRNNNKTIVNVLFMPASKSVINDSSVILSEWFLIRH